MKLLKITLFALAVLAVLVLVVVLPSLGSRSVGMVGGWVWKSLWTLVGVVGATSVLLLGGAYTVVFFWRRRFPETTDALSP